MTVHYLRFELNSMSLMQELCFVGNVSWHELYVNLIILSHNVGTANINAMETIPLTMITHCLGMVEQYKMCEVLFTNLILWIYDAMELHITPCVRQYAQFCQYLWHLDVR